MDHDELSEDAPALRTGRVLRADAKLYHVDFGDEVRVCAPRGRLFEALDADVKTPIAVGDRVEVSLEGDPPGIERVLPRRNWLGRHASSHDPREQILFANVDQLFVVGSLANPRFSSNRTDRILAACQYAEIPARLVLNKADLDRRGEADAIRATYEAAGIEVLTTCATSGGGLEILVPLLRGRVSVFYGASGAGKSTLLNAIQPGLGLRTGKISKYWDTGKHTTSFSQMHRLESADGWVVDTPGIRVFRPYGINRAELRDLFPEFGPFQRRCEFDDCSHDHEPGCAVVAALERGDLSPSRYASYLEMLEELDEPPPEEARSPSGP